MHAKLKESLAEPKPNERFDELLDALQKLEAPSQPPPSPVVASYTMPTHLYHNAPRPHGNQSLNRDEIAQMIPQEIRRATNHRFDGPNQRGCRTLNSRPICDFCHKPGHIRAVCRQQQNQRRDPRIPIFPRPAPRNTLGRTSLGYCQPAKFKLNTISVGWEQSEIENVIIYNGTDKHSQNESAHFKTVSTHAPERLCTHLRFFTDTTQFSIIRFRRILVIAYKISHKIRHNLILT